MNTTVDSSQSNVDSSKQSVTLRIVSDKKQNSSFTHFYRLNITKRNGPSSQFFRGQRFVAFMSNGKNQK